MGLKNDLEMNKNLSKLIDEIANNRRMPREKIIEMLKDKILLSWGKANSDLNLPPLKVEVNEQEQEVEIYISKQVVEVVEDETSQIIFQQAMKINPNAKVGDNLFVRAQPDLVQSVLPGAVRELFTGITEEFSGEGRIGRIRSLPRIPIIPEPILQIPETAAPVPPSNESPQIRRDAEERDRETTDLISIFVNERVGSQTGQQERIPSPPSSDELPPDSKKVFLEIERALAEYDYLKIKETLNELHVDYLLPKRSFTTIFHVHNQSITAKSLLPCALGAAADLLELCGQADFASIIGRVSQGGKFFYIIKNSYTLRGLSKGNLREIVCQSILEASKAMKIIERYL
jgi:hypothetical protein